MLTYPFHRAVLGWLLGLGLAGVVVRLFTGVLNFRWVPRFEVWTTASEMGFAVIGVCMEVLWWLLALKIAVEAMRAGAVGRNPHSRHDEWIDDEQALRQVLLWAGLLLAGYALFLALGEAVLWLYCGLVVPVLPAILVLLGMEDSLKRAFDPAAWLGVLKRAGADYALVLVKLALLVLVIGFVVVQVVPHEPRWMNQLLSRMAVLYLLFGGYHELGLMLDRNQRETETPVLSEIPVAAVLTDEEALAMRAAERYGAEQRFSRGARELEPLATRAGASPLLHARFRELLFLAGELDTLVRCSRAYVPELLSRSLARDALRLYQDSLEVDPGFELAEPHRITQLIHVCLAEQQLEMAIALARGFLRRFPDDADAVSNGLVAARLLDRQGKDEDARQLLIELVRRFRQHPMRGELVAALETLESVARRGN